MGRSNVKMAPLPSPALSAVSDPSMSRAASAHHADVNIGDAAAGIAFKRSNFYGDFYASFSLRHGCVIVHQASATDFAFVSPRNGRAYRTCQECGAGTRLAPLRRKIKNEKNEKNKWSSFSAFSLTSHAPASVPVLSIQKSQIQDSI